MLFLICPNVSVYVQRYSYASKLRSVYVLFCRFYLLVIIILTGLLIVYVMLFLKINLSGLGRLGYNVLAMNRCVAIACKLQGCIVKVLL